MADTILTIKIPEAQVARVIAAICANHGYQKQVPDPSGALPPTMVPNPQTPIMFARQYMKEHVLHEVRQHEAKVAADSAFNGAASAVNAEITIT